MKTVAVRRQPLLSLLLQDAARAVIAGLIALAVIAAVVAPPATRPYWLDFLGRALAALGAEVATLVILRAVIPRPSPGSHLVDSSWPHVRWLLSSALAEVALNPIPRLPFWSLHFTRVLYLKALGADIAWNATIHPAIVLRDPSLLSVEDGAQLEPGVVIESALHGAGRVRVDRVTIGKGCLVGAHSVLMPGATLGHDARIEPATIVGEDVHVGVGAAIGEGVRLERGVDLGSYATVGTGAILSEGVRVGDRAKVSSGAIVEPRTEIGEREIWSGIPARRVEERAPSSVAARNEPKA